MKLLAGSSNIQMAEAIGFYLDKPIGRAQARVFSDQEMEMLLLEAASRYPDLSPGKVHFFNE